MVRPGRYQCDQVEGASIVRIGEGRGEQRIWQVRVSGRPYEHRHRGEVVHQVNAAGSLTEAKAWASTLPLDRAWGEEQAAALAVSLREAERHLQAEAAREEALSAPPASSARRAPRADAPVPRQVHATPNVFASRRRPDWDGPETVPYVRSRPR